MCIPFWLWSNLEKHDQHCSIPIRLMLASAHLQERMTYAAAAPSVSNGLTTVVKETKHKNITTKVVMIASRCTTQVTNANTQRGTINIISPIKAMITLTNMSIRRFEV